MPTVADELIVKLVVDGSEMSKGVKKAEEDVGKVKKGTKEAGEASKKAGKDGADAFAAFRREAVGALALFTGGKSIAGFANDITKANTALGNMAQQLDIAPQKLNQLHQAMVAAGGGAGSVDSFFGSLQAKAADGAGRGELVNLGKYLGVNLLDEHNHVRADAIEQLNASPVFRGMSRGLQNNYIAQLGGNADIAMLANQKNLKSSLQKYANTGPTDEQIRRSQQMLADWTELKASTDKIGQQTLSELEPTVHNFTQALLELEKAHPGAIATGMKDLALALGVISALLTARGFMSSLKIISGMGGGASAAGIAKGAGAMGAAGAGAWAADSFFHSDISHKITGSIAEGEKYARDTWGLNKTMNDLLQRDIDRRHDLIKNNGGLLGTGGVALAEWWDIGRTGASALLGGTSLSSSTQTAGNQPWGNSRGERNHNPGNLRFARQTGATPQDPNNPDHTFAVFKSDEEGVTALKKQIGLYNNRDHLDTVSDMLNKYAPESDHNNTRDYITRVSKGLGVGRNQHLGKLTPQQMAAIMHGVIGVETANHDHYGGMVERIAGLSNAASAPRMQQAPAQHTNTTHAPVNITIHGGNNSPHEIAHAVSNRIAHTIANGQTGRVG